MMKIINKKEARIAVMGFGYVGMSIEVLFANKVVGIKDKREIAS